MEALDTLVVDHIEEDQRRIIISRGSLIADPSEFTSDYLLISCKCYDYDPAQGGSVGELSALGISVQELEDTCDADFRPLLPCWISTVQSGKFFKRLVVFEPEPNKAAQDTWKVFQALHGFAGSSGSSTLALTVFSGDNIDANMAVMLRVILFAGASLAARSNWSRIDIIVPPENADAAAVEFAQLKASYLDPPLEPDEVLKELKLIKARYPQFEKNAQKPTLLPEDFGLTPRQHGLLYAYCRNSSAYFNTILRSENITSPAYAFFHSSLEALSTALANLKEYRVNSKYTYRLINAFPGIDEIYTIGASVHEAAYTSTSFRKDMPGTTHRLIIQSTIGKNVGPVAGIETEQEILYDHSMSHLVFSVEPPKPGENRIVIKSKQLLPNTTNLQFSHV